MNRYAKPPANRLALLTAGVVVLSTLLACAGGGAPPAASSDPWAGLPTENLSTDHVPYLVIRAEEGWVGASTDLGLLRSDLRIESVDGAPGVWTAATTSDGQLYTLQVDHKLYRLADAGSKPQRLFTSAPSYMDASSAPTGLAASAEHLYALDSLGSESTIWQMANAEADGDGGPAGVEVVATLPTRAVGLHLDSDGVLYTLPAPEGSGQIDTLWRWDTKGQTSSETRLSLSVPVPDGATTSEVMPGLRAQMFDDEAPWIGVIVQTQIDMGTPFELPTMEERVFRVHRETGEIRVVGTKQMTWP